MAYQIICEICNKSFKSRQPHKKTCSSACWKTRNEYFYDRVSVGNPNPGTVGAISELAASCYLMEEGFNVFRALSPSCPWDLIAIKDDLFLKIDVTTGYRSKKSGKIFNPKNLIISREKKVDLIAVYVRKEKSCIFLDMNGKIWMNNPARPLEI